MRRADLPLIAVWTAAVLLLAGSALWRADRSLFNFGDLYIYHYPMRHLTAAALQEGRLPFWNPYILSGVPLLANPQSVLFYPLSTLGFVLPLSLALTWDSVLHLLWAALGVTLLARREGLSAGQAAVLAVAYALSPFLVYRVTAGIPTLVASLAWAPWCWLAMLSRRRGLLAVCWALQLLSGHPQFMIVNAAGMALWAALRRPSLWLDLAVEGAGALALTVLQWAPTAQFLARSVRAEWPEAFARAYSLAPKDWLTALLPDVFGNPVDGTYAGLPSYFFEASGLFVGTAALAVWRPTRAAALTAAGAALSLGFSGAMLRTPARWLLLSLWGLLAGAGSGLRRAGPALTAAVFAATLIQLGAWDARFLRPEPIAPYLGPNHRVAAQLTGPFRVLTDPELANQNKTMLYRALNVNGYEAFYLKGYAEFAAKSEGAPAADSSRVFMSKVSQPLLRAGLGVVVDKTGATHGVGAGPGLAYPAGGDVPTTKAAVFLHRPELWEVRGRIRPGADRVVVTIPAYPGWTAELNGKPATLEPHGYFQAVRAAEGPFSLIVRYSPPAWALLVLLTAAAWLTLAWRLRGA